MRKALESKSWKKYTIFILIYLATLSQLSIVEARKGGSSGYSHSDKVSGGEGWVSYDFAGGNNYEIKANINVDFKMEIDQDLTHKTLKLNITNEVDIILNITNSQFSKFPKQNQFHNNFPKYRNRWGAYFHFQVNTSIASIEISSKIDEDNDVTGDDKWIIFDESGEGTILDTSEDGEYIISIISDSGGDFYLTIISDAPDYSSLIIFIVLMGIGAISITLMMSKIEYREFLKNRIMPNSQIRYRLSIEEVLENENRSKIIDHILDEPGIHFNQLLRKTGLSPGNLVWHLDILETYQITGKKNVGQYLVYFPYYDTNPMSNIDIKLAKSKVTLQILNIIEKSPGIYGNLIAKQLKLDHKTVKYHLDKLLEGKLIRIEKQGRKNLLFLKLGGSIETNFNNDDK